MLQPKSFQPARGEREVSLRQIVTGGDRGMGDGGAGQRPGRISNSEAAMKPNSVIA